MLSIPSTTSAGYICYPACDASVCVNDRCSLATNAYPGDKISLVHLDLNLAKKVTVGDMQIDTWNLSGNTLLEFILPTTIKTGTAFVNVYDFENDLIASGSLTIRSQPSCTADTWICGSYGACGFDSRQYRSCTKTFDCPTTDTPSPPSTQNCTLPQQTAPTQPPQYQSPQQSCATDVWSCGDWGSCSISGIQNRSCRKTFDCPGVETAPPAIDQYCVPPSRPSQQVPQDSNVISNQDTIIKATVKLICPLDANRASQGSGTVIDPSGIILTNKHVISGIMGCLVGFINTYSDEPYFADRQIADIDNVSSNEDIAILKLRNPQNRKLPYIDITKSNSNLILGTKISIYGYPAIFGANMTFSSGDFSGTSGSYLKTTAIIEHGNSGGGAYTNSGMFIGVPSAVVKGQLNALGYILSLNTINSWLGNSSVAHNDSSSNSYSRVSSVLDNIDLNSLGSLQLVIPGNDSSPTNQASPSSSTSISFANRLRGRILLQVESRGEAWYVHPNTGKRHYMRDGGVAYQMMRSFGLGITDSDLAKIPTSDSEQTMKDSSTVCSTNPTANRVKGKILLQVQQHGEAWYVHPDKCRRIYMKDGSVAYQIMRFLSLGITNADLTKLPEGNL